MSACYVQAPGVVCAAGWGLPALSEAVFAPTP